MSFLQPSLRERMKSRYNLVVNVTVEMLENKEHYAWKKTDNIFNTSIENVR